jgi:hypothetical protein
VVSKKPDIELDRRGLMKLMREAAHNRNLYDVFRDFCEAAAISISNAVDIAQREAREARWEQIKAAYSPEDWALFPKMLACVVGEFERVDFADVLGSTFMELELANKDAGQFFTPYTLCKVMARVTVDESLKARVAEKGYVTANDPATGGGATLIAFAEAMKEAGLNHQTQLHVTAKDLDPRAVHMTYIQLSLLHIPAVVICGDTLRMTETSRWYTPAHILGGWNWKLMERQFDEIKKYERPEQALTVSPDVTLPPVGEQIALFPEAA